MNPFRKAVIAATIIFLALGAGAANATYWNVFNLEGESSASAVFVTYATLPDMLTDTNRTGAFEANGHAPFGSNIVGSGSNGTAYWNVFNLEGESSASAVFVTYATLLDMVMDTNRTGAFEANGHAPFGSNIVGSGSNGTSYWNVFNLEGESSASAVFVTYATLLDMVMDTNRTGAFEANGHAPFGSNIVGSGSNGTAYWNVFNLEGESSASAVFVTYATLLDMLTDTNRTGAFEANGHAPFGSNIVGSGSDEFQNGGGNGNQVPEPATVVLLGIGLAGISVVRKRMKKQGTRVHS